MRRLAAIAIVGLLPACSTGAGRIPILTDAPIRPAATAPAPTPTSEPVRQPARQPARQPVRQPEIQREVGFEGVIGSPAATLIKQLGTPRIDLVEGDARKLQFAGESCVLDIFLYPTTPGAEPVATQITARLRAGGAKADTGRCLAEILRR